MKKGDGKTIFGAPEGAPADRPIVLVVDDDEMARLLACESLEQFGMTVEEATNGREGVEAFERLRPDLTLMDVLMPEMDGFAACAAIRTRPGGKLAPILMMTGLNDVESISRAYEAGATDFATKPIQGNLLGFRASYLIRAGKTFGKLQQAEAENRVLLQELCRKNEDLERYNRTLWDQATRDGLTGLYNYRFLQEAMVREISRSLRSGIPLCVIILDVDWFKNYNDLHGHLMGDSVLRTMAEILLGRVRNTDIVARYGGEEFVVLLPEVGLEYGLQIAEELRISIAAHPFPERETQPAGTITASFGVSVYPEDGKDPTGLIRQADLAMYEAKGSGRNCVRVASGREITPGTANPSPGPKGTSSATEEIP